VPKPRRKPLLIGPLRIRDPEPTDRSQPGIGHRLERRELPEGKAN